MCLLVCLCNSSLNGSRELMNGRSDFAIFIFSQPEDRFRMEPPWVRGTKVLLNDLDRMRAATPIYGNIFFYRNTGLIGPL